MDSLLQDLRFAVRSLRRSPGFAFTVIAVMALGIGVNAMIFTVVRGIMLQSLPFPESDRIVTLASVSSRYPDAVGGTSMSQLDLNDVIQGTRQLSAGAGYLETQLSMALKDDAERFTGT